MKTGALGIALIKSFESLQLTAYMPRPGDRWTLGWGSTFFNGIPVVQGQTCTQDEADAQLVRDLAQAEAEVNKVVTVPLSQNQFDALVSFDDNEGDGRLASSTLLKYLNQRKYTLAGCEFLKWNQAGGVIMAGLVRRRQAEMTLFNTP